MKQDPGPEQFDRVLVGQVIPEFSGPRRSTLLKMGGPKTLLKLIRLVNDPEMQRFNLSTIRLYGMGQEPGRVGLGGSAT